MPPTRTAQTKKCDLTVQRTRSKTLFSSINSYRRSKNLPPLTWDDQLFTYCVLHNIDMHSSRIKSSSFNIGQQYNENTCSSVRSGEILETWRSRDQEKQNLLCDGVKYSALAIFGDDQECYATQIFTARKPRGDVPSMKSHKPCNTCRGRKSSSRKKSSASTAKATSVASTRISSSRRRSSTRPSSRPNSGLPRSASVPGMRSSSSARTGLRRRASSGPRSGETRRASSTPRSGATRRSSFTPHSGETRRSSVPRTTSSSRRSIMRGIGKSIGQSLRSGLKRVGGALTRGGTHSCPQCRSVSRRGSSGRSSRRGPDCCDCGFLGGPSMRFPGERRGCAGPGFPRMPGMGSFSSDDSFDCIICNCRRTLDFCDTCSRGGC